MTTRLYLPSAGTPAVTPPAADAIWDTDALSSGTAPVLPLVSAKTNTALATLTTAVETSTSNSFDSLLARFVSTETIPSDRVIGRAFLDQSIRFSRPEAASDPYVQIVVKVISGDGSTVRGTLLAANTATTALGAVTGERMEFLSSLTTRAWWGVPLTEVAALAGDRILVEVGVRFTNTVATAYTASASFGDPSATGDLAVSSNSGSALCPWIEFHEDIFAATPIASPYAREVIEDQPFGYWRLGDLDNNNGILGEDDTTKDYVGGYHLGPSGSPTRGVTGLLVNDADKAVTFGTSGQYFRETGYPITGHTAISAESWFKSSAPAATVGMLLNRWGASSATASWNTGINASGYARAVIGGGTDTELLGSVNLCDGAAHHLVLTYEDTDHIARLYVDGAEVASATHGANIYTNASTYIGLGDRVTGSGNPFPGTIDEAAYYTRRLSAAEVLSHYQVGTNTVPVNSTLTAILPGPSAALSGAFIAAVDSTLVGTLPAATGALAGDTVVYAALDGTLPSPTGASAGTFLPLIDSTLTGTLPALSGTFGPPPPASVLTGVVASPTATATGWVNLLPNPSAEISAGWRNNTALYPAVFDLTVARSGGQSVKGGYVEAQPPTTQALSIFAVGGTDIVTKLPVTPGQVYTGSVHGTANFANFRVGIRLGFYNGATFVSGTIVYSVAGAGAPGEWVRMFQTATVPAGVNGLWVAAYVIPGSGNVAPGGEAWLDDAMLTAGSTLHPYHPPVRVGTLAGTLTPPTGNLGGVETNLAGQLAPPVASLAGTAVPPPVAVLDATLASPTGNLAAWVVHSVGVLVGSFPFPSAHFTQPYSTDVDNRANGRLRSGTGTMEVAPPVPVAPGGIHVEPVRVVSVALPVPELAEGRPV